jgi:hypothetical protein
MNAARTAAKQEVYNVCARRAPAMVSASPNGGGTLGDRGKCRGPTGPFDARRPSGLAKSGHMRYSTNFLRISKLRRPDLQTRSVAMPFLSR